MPNCKFYRENMVSRASRTRNDFGSICASFIISQFFLDHEKKKLEMMTRVAVMKLRGHFWMMVMNQVHNYINHPGDWSISTN